MVAVQAIPGVELKPAGFDSSEKSGSGSGEWGSPTYLPQTEEYIHRYLGRGVGGGGGKGNGNGN